MTANRKRGEVTLELGGEKYVLRPELGVIAEIEDELDTVMIRLGMKIEQIQLRAKELLRTVQVIVKANGYEVAEETLAKAIAKDGVAAAMAPLIVYVRNYAFGSPEENSQDTELPAGSKSAASRAPL